jgi:hypothetical protein
MRTPTAPRRGAIKALAGAAAAATAVLLGACGSGDAGAAQVTSIEDALGLDENAIQEREAKVQEEVRRCMEAEGFDYLPMDPSRLNVRVIGPGREDNAEFRRTKGYGITTTFGERPAVEENSADPNGEIREAMSEEERQAYDKALFGAAAAGEDGGGSFSVRIGPGVGSVEPAGEAPDPAQMGCFGQAQEKVGSNDKLERLGPQLQELQERIASDPRMVRANAAWAACMSEAGFDFETPEDIPPFLFGKVQELQQALDGGTSDPPGGQDELRAPDPEQMEALLNSPELASLQREELALAKADDACSESTGRRDTAKKVRAEAEKRFLDEHPDLGAGGGEG